jgi:hypothetical protein
VADPSGEAGPIGAPTQVGIRLAQCGDAGEDEYKHRRQRCHACDCAVKDEHRKDREYRVQRESDAYTVTDQTHTGDTTRAQAWRPTPLPGGRWRIDNGSVAGRHACQRLDEAPAVVLEIAVYERDDGHLGRR